MVFAFLQRKRTQVSEIAPDEIFLDASNLPQFDRHQFEGRLEKSITRRVVSLMALVSFSILLLIAGRSFFLQVARGSEYATRSERNRLHQTIVFGDRGVIRDRVGTLLAWNEEDPKAPEFSFRRYAPTPGLAHTLGFIKYPSKDSAGFYYKVDFEGKDGVEKYWNEYLAPLHGMRILEVNAHGAVESESVQKPAQNGGNVTLSIDARLSEKLYEFIEKLAVERHFEGGAGVLMDVASGEILALSSVPEYNAQILSDGADNAGIARVVADTRKPFLNRVTNGLYTPGSIVKPFLALAALEEGVITPEKEIVSTGSISVPNQYDPAHPSVFKDWRAHGATDMRRALAVSSDVYFYEIGGGFPGQAGLGIEKIEKYMREFGFGSAPTTGNDFFGAAGVIPNPKWKSETFNKDAWRLGDTYHTAIGQYGFQVTPLQAARAIAAIANGGKLLEPRLILENDPPRYVLISAASSSFQVVREGMRDAVTEGTASGLNIPQVTVAAKTGTAELGSRKQFVNSWIVGFFPFDAPRYAFAIIMERGPSENTVGGLFVMRELLEWMSVYTPEYLAPASPN